MADTFGRPLGRLGLLVVLLCLVSAVRCGDNEQRLDNCAQCEDILQSMEMGVDTKLSCRQSCAAAWPKFDCEFICNRLIALKAAGKIPCWEIGYCKEREREEREKREEEEKKRIEQERKEKELEELKHRERERIEAERREREQRVAMENEAQRLAEEKARLHRERDTLEFTRRRFEEEKAALEEERQAMREERARLRAAQEALEREANAAVAYTGGGPAGHAGTTTTTSTTPTTLVNNNNAIKGTPAERESERIRRLRKKKEEELEEERQLKAMIEAEKEKQERLRKEFELQQHLLAQEEQAKEQRIEQHLLLQQKEKEEDEKQKILNRFERERLAREKQQPYTPQLVATSPSTPSSSGSWCVFSSPKAGDLILFEVIAWLIIEFGSEPLMVFLGDLCMAAPEDKLLFYMRMLQVGGIVWAFVRSFFVFLVGLIGLRSTTPLLLLSFIGVNVATGSGEFLDQEGSSTFYMFLALELGKRLAQLVHEIWALVKIGQGVGLLKSSLTLDKFIKVLDYGTMCLLLTSAGAGHCAEIAVLFLGLEAASLINNLVSTLNILMNDIMRMDLVAGGTQIYALYFVLMSVIQQGLLGPYVSTELWVSLIILCLVRAKNAYSDLYPYLKGYLSSKSKED